MQCKTFKQAKKGQKSFRITSQLVDSIYQKARKVKKKGELVLIIPCDNKYNYTLNCKVTKTKK